MLPGTCLVVESGVMVEDNYWEFEASVWDATQQQQQQRDKHPHQQLQQQQCEQNDGAKAEESKTLGIDNVTSVSRFQNTDLPHPGWEDLILTQVTEETRP